MAKLPSLLELLKSGAHFGHQKSRWHPKMAPYIFGARGGIHIIDLEKTLVELEKTLGYAKNLASEGKVILFVGTKRQTRDLVKKAATESGMPYLVERWIGGLLTNFDEMKRRLRKYHGMKEQIATGEVEKYTKKEQVKFKKDLEKMDRYLVGLSDMDKMPDAIYVADMRTEKTAIAEATRKSVPIIGVCDTNVNPEEADYIIPMNDDAVNSIRLSADLLAEAINEGRKDYEKKKVEAPAVKSSPVSTDKKFEPKAPVRRALRKEGSE